MNHHQARRRSLHLSRPMEKPPSSSQACCQFDSNRFLAQAQSCSLACQATRTLNRSKAVVQSWSGAPAQLTRATASQPPKLHSLPSFSYASFTRYHTTSPCKHKPSAATVRILLISPASNCSPFAMPATKQGHPFPTTSTQALILGYIPRQPVTPGLHNCPFAIIIDAAASA